MSCNNVSEYVAQTDKVCGDSMAVVIDTCHEVCLVSIIYLMNKCLMFVVGMDDIKEELVEIITFCYNKLNPH